MVVAGALLFVLGLFFLAIPVIGLWSRWFAGRLLRRLHAAANLTCAELAAGPLPREVLLTGRTAPGPGDRAPGRRRSAPTTL